MIKNQKLVELYISQVLVVGVWSNFISPAVIFVLLTHPVDLLIIFSSFCIRVIENRRKFFMLLLTLIFLLYLVWFARGHLNHFKICVIFCFYYFEFEASTSVSELWISNNHKMILFKKAERNGWSLQSYRSILVQNSSGSLLVRVFSMMWGNKRL